MYSISIEFFVSIGVALFELIMIYNKTKWNQFIFFLLNFLYYCGILHYYIRRGGNYETKYLMISALIYILSAIPVQNKVSFESSYTRHKTKATIKQIRRSIKLSVFCDQEQSFKLWRISGNIIRNFIWNKIKEKKNNIF
jgi:hypothetical protein